MKRSSRLHRFLDYYVGVPLIFLIGLFKRIKRKRAVPPDSGVLRVGILATAAIGDTILISAVLNDFRLAYPKAEISFFAGKSNAQAAELTCPADRIIVIPVSRPDKAIRIIRETGLYDLWVDFGQWPRVNALISAAAKSRCAIGFRTPGQGRHFAYDRWVRHSSECHEIDNLRSLAALAGVESFSSPRVEPQWTQDKQGDYIAIHMIPGGYKSHYKEWSAARWVSLMDKLTEAGFHILLTGAKTDQNKTERVRCRCSRPEMIENTSGKMVLAKVPEVLSRARLLISVNTGIMHMAAAVGVPLIALHGPTSAERWGPVTSNASNAVNIQATSPSAGCLNLGFEYDRRDRRSLDTVHPGDVLAAALSILENSALEKP